MKPSTLKSLPIFNNQLVKISLIALLCGLILLNCHKSADSVPIAGITGITWKVYAVQETSDNSINPLPTDWTLQLNDDRNFSIHLGSTICTGSYSWTGVDTVSARVTFSIGSWNNPSQSQDISDKLKKILTGSNSCYFYKAPFTAQNPAPPGAASMVLQFQGSEGYFYVYK